MYYLYLKALHVFAAMAWLSGMILVGVTLAFLGKMPRPPIGRKAILTYLAWWDRHVTSPAMLVTWGIGLFMAVKGGWFAQYWIVAKMALVVVLSGIHGMLSGRLRRLTRDADAQAPAQVAVLATLAVATLAIVLLVVVKPF